MKENKIEKKFRDGILSIGGLCYKFVSPGNTGVPDRIVILRTGKVIFVELKTKYGRLSPIQKRQLQRLNARKAQSAVIRGEKEMNDFLDYCERESGNEYELT